MRLSLLPLLVVMVAYSPSNAGAQAMPTNDYHQHLLSPSLAKLIGELTPFTASDLIAEMDAAGIQHSLVLSLAYQFGNPNRVPVVDEYAMVKAENDWTADQVKGYSDRLLAACGVDPLKEYAYSEIERCSQNPYLRSALKLHFGNSDVDLDNREHIKKLRAVFQAADAHGMAIIVHMHANVNRHRPYGTREARIFLTQVLPAAPHIYVQIAHLAGSGGFDDPGTLAALNVFVKALHRNDPRTSRLYFDISGVAGLGNWELKKEQIASSIRAIGVGRVLFGSDGAWTDFTPQKAIAAYRQLPLTAQEFQTIDRNALPTLPWR